MSKFTLKVLKIKIETNDTITICFKQPGIRKIKYLAGQYLTLILRINGRRYARAYSFSSAPSVDATLDVTVKRVPEGVVSNYINNELKVGDVVEVLEPMGDFTYNTINTKQTVFLWGVGSGITPLYSLTKEILNTQTDTKIHLVYGNKCKNSTIFLNELVQLNQKFQSNFNLTQFFSQVETLDENGSFRGRISSEFVASLMGKQKNLIESLHYICGPKNLKNVIHNSLLELKVPSSSIFIEEFELVIDTQELYDVQDSKVTIDFQGQLSEIFVPKGKSILDVAFDNGIELPYSCQTGNCSTCKVKLINGELKMLGLTNDRDDLLKNEFLLCCSYPLTDTISIEA